MISERLKRSLNIRALLVEGCLVDDEARDEGADCFPRQVERQARTARGVNAFKSPVVVSTGGLKRLLYRPSLCFYLQRTSPCSGFYLTITASFRWGCFSLAQFTTALIARPSHLVARICGGASAHRAASPAAGRSSEGPAAALTGTMNLINPPHRPGRQLKRM